MITMIAFIQTCVDESNARFDRMLKEMTDHKDGKAQMMQDLEYTSALKLEKAQEDLKLTSSEFLTELQAMKHDALDAYTAATKINIKTEDDLQSPECIESSPHGLNLDSEQKLLFPFASIDKPRSASSKWKL